MVEGGKGAAEEDEGCLEGAGQRGFGDSNESMDDQLPLPEGMEEKKEDMLEHHTKR